MVRRNIAILPAECTLSEAVQYGYIYSKPCPRLSSTGIFIVNPVRGCPVRLYLQETLPGSRVPLYLYETLSKAAQCCNIYRKPCPRLSTVSSEVIIFRKTCSGLSCSVIFIGKTVQGCPVQLYFVGNPVRDCHIQLYLQETLNGAGQYDHTYKKPCPRLSHAVTFIGNPDQGWPI